MAGVTMKRMAARIERISANDLTTLATDKGQVPMNIGALLTFAPVADPAEVVRRLAERLVTIPRFRQRLLRPGLGGGRPAWVEDGRFRLRDHVSGADIPGPVARDTLLDHAAQMVCTRLPDHSPLWRLHWVDRLDQGGFSVVIVMHHVLADGMGGLGVLAALADGVPAARALPAAALVPTGYDLFKDANRHRRAALRGAGPALRRALAGVRELGLGRQRPALAQRSSIVAPTTGRRVLRTVSCELNAVLAAGHRHGATLNDVVLAAVAGALFETVAGRGENLRELVISVPVSARSEPASDDLGNQVGAVPVTVPNGLEPVRRLQVIAARTGAARSQERGSSAIVLSWLFRALAAVRLGQFFVDHQRLVHTFETNLRGPAEPVVLAGARIEEIVPVAVNPGNVGVSFDVLSYAGSLTISVVADPVVVPEIDQVGSLLAQQLDALIASPC